MNIPKKINIPKNDEQVEISLKFSKESLIGENLCLIFRCQRKSGADLLTAYKNTLLAHVDTIKRLHSKNP